MTDMVSQSLGLIERYLLPATLADAVTRLATFCDQVVVLDLYQHLFSQEFVVSSASLVAEVGHAYCPREIEFFALVTAHLFPFPAEQFGQLKARQQTFWIPSYGIDHENLQSLSQLKGGWQLVYFFMVIETWEIDGEDIDYWLDEMEYCEELAPILRAAAQAGVYLHQFLAECRAGPEPLCYLSEAFDICAQATENIFYEVEDGDAEEVEDEEASGRFVPRFTLDAFAVLTDDWCEAQVIEAHCDALMVWMDTGPEKYVEVATLWATYRMNHP